MAFWFYHVPHRNHSSTEIPAYNRSPRQKKQTQTLTNLWLLIILPTELSLLCFKVRSGLVFQTSEHSCAHDLQFPSVDMYVPSCDVGLKSWHHWNQGESGVHCRSSELSSLKKKYCFLHFFFGYNMAGTHSKKAPTSRCCEDESFG